MGSLMAGWNCAVLDPETARLERNKSLTREEIESFWKVRRKSCDDGEDQEEHAALSPTYSPVIGRGESEAVGRDKSSVFWQSREKSKTTSPGGSSDQPESLVGADKVAKLTGDWWTRSNWAFLNEPPHDEVDDSSHKYAAQFHVAQMATATKKQPAH